MGLLLPNPPVIDGAYVSTLKELNEIIRKQQWTLRRPEQIISICPDPMKKAYLVTWRIEQ